MKLRFPKACLAAALIAANITLLAACGSAPAETDTSSAPIASGSSASAAPTSTANGAANMPQGTPPGDPPGDPPGSPPSGGPGNGQGTPPDGSGSAEADHGSYATLVTGNSAGATYESTGDSENAVRVEGTDVTLTDAAINKISGSTGSGDSSNFYGVNAGLLATDGANVTLNNAKVGTSAEGGNGIFSYGESTTVTVNNSTINTTADSSGGIMVTGGGTMYVNKTTINTQGAHSAALRTDRGGGTLVVDGGTYTTSGQGSPAIYSTADISVSNAALTATGSEALVIEGKNSINLTDCAVSGNMTSGNSENLQNVMIYQSMSGDANSGVSSLKMTNGSLAANNGDMIYVTNTSCTIDLTNVALKLCNDVLLKVAGNDARNGWGTAGSNGGACVFTASGQVLTDKIIVDSISSLDLKLTNGSAFTGTINNGKEGGTVSVDIDSTSKWTLTGDSYVANLTGTTANIDTNGYTLYVDGAAYKQ